MYESEIESTADESEEDDSDVILQPLPFYSFTAYMAASGSSATAWFSIKSRNTVF